MKKAALLSVIFLFSLFSLGCNTMDGLGKDIEKGGEVIQEKAESNK